MKLFGIRLFESREDPALAEVKMAVLQGLLDAQRVGATPEERYAAMLQLGDQELGKPASAASPRLEKNAQQPAVEAAPAVETTPGATLDAVSAAEGEAEPTPMSASIQELETAKLVELLGGEDKETS